MAGEWKFGQFTWSPVGSGETSQDLMDNIESFLTQVGWELTAIGDAGDRYYLWANRATEDLWEFTGDGVLKHCGINVWNEQYNGGAMDGTARIHVRAWLQNEAGDAVDGVAHDDATVYVDFNEAADNDFLLVGGEDGFYLEGYTSGQASRDVVVGMITTFRPWVEMHGTRDEERKYMSQGLGMDWRGTTRFALDSRNSRVVVNDGVDSNKTGGLAPYVVRRSSMYSATIIDDARPFIGAFDTIFGMWYRYDADSTQYFRSRYSFGLLNANLDDRWRLCPILVHQEGAEEEDVYGAVYSTSDSNNVAAYFRSRWFDIRSQFRMVPRVFAASPRLTPWQLITDEVSGNQYRLVDMDDGGRNVYLAVEWPGAAEEVTI